MGREKMVGENLRDGDMEVAFELWIEQIFILVDSNGIPPLSGEAISELKRVPVL
jgi:hypothetical protein